MEEGDSSVRRWEDLYIDILVKILQSFDLFELTAGLAHVCSVWRLACSDQFLWMTLDLSILKSNFIKISLEPYVYVDCQSDKTLTSLLKICLNLSCGNILTLIFHYNLYVSDDQLTYTAERRPCLKRLVMPSWNRIKKIGICRAIRMWEYLESLTMPSIANPSYVLEEIGRSYKNFAELKIMWRCDMLFASTLVSFLPNLEVLSVRCAMLSKSALFTILDELDESILEKASRSHKFLTCMSDSCIMCQRTRNDEGLMRWYKYEEDLWKVDEVRSLAI
ncbi:F-box/LRR-repeat protein At3g48880-like [Solanum dulcamara]|uniref:F-box/LRR-repeat protein At3g48880-like n=1 Tax=Solanum dulcamara TaxID=45834 RepID=UPI00248658C8|nr:F-box/LRR-repeat protein At3g48880-like [Solanum dulcamara]